MATLDHILANDERFLPRSTKHLSYEQRIAEMNRMQKAFFQLLRESPELYAEFMARNFKKRATDWKEPDQIQHA